jgi:hypothetical protein
MCGRQMTVTLCFFIIARVTTINIDIGNEDNIFGVSDPIQKMFNLGFMGALVTTILGSITWQLVAGAFPIAFLSNPIVYIFLQLALFLEATGICAAAWFLAVVQRKVLGFQFDEVYIGTPEERAAKGHADTKEAGDNLQLGTNLPTHEVGKQVITKEYMDIVEQNFTNQREKVMANIAEIREQISQAPEGEKAVFEQALKLEVDNLKALNENHETSMRDLKKMRESVEEAV